MKTIVYLTGAVEDHMSEGEDYSLQELLRTMCLRVKTIVYLTGAVDNHVSEGEDSIVIYSLPYRCMLVKTSFSYRS